MGNESVKYLASLLINRMRMIYNPVYIDKCEKEEPDSLLGLCKRLELALNREKS